MRKTSRNIHSWICSAWLLVLHGMAYEQHNHVLVFLLFLELCFQYSFQLQKKKVRNYMDVPIQCSKISNTSCLPKRHRKQCKRCSNISAMDILAWTFRSWKMPKMDVSAITIDCGWGEGGMHNFVWAHACEMH